MATRRTASSGGRRTGARAGRGGARTGAGRKRDVVPAEVMARVGPLPPRDKPLQIGNQHRDAATPVAARSGDAADLAP
jgi:hypothetical protein